MFDVDAALGSSSQQQVPQDTKKKYPCEYPNNPCSRTFARTNDRLTHYRVDHEDLKFECSVCQKRFKQKRHVDDHMPIHTGDYKYQCNQCDYGTKSASRLASHQKKHTRVEPFTEESDGKIECNICKKTFDDKKKFRDHARRVDCRKYAQFTCPVVACRQPCQSLRAVKNHLATEHKDLKKKPLMQKLQQQMDAYEEKTRNAMFNNFCDKNQEYKNLTCLIFDD